MARLTQDPERVNPVRAVHIWRSPPGSPVEMLIVAHLEAYSVMHEHATAALPNETGGFLIGRVAFDHRDGCWHIEIEEAVPVSPESQDPVHFTFTWRDVDRVRSYREGQGKALVGWFHTHPDLGIFLSETDLERTHRVLFNEPFQVALVYDPIRGRAGYFYWDGPQTIDAGQAGWREFEIAVHPDAAEAPAAPAAPDAAQGTERRSDGRADEPTATQVRRLREIPADVPAWPAEATAPTDDGTSRSPAPAKGAGPDDQAPSTRWRIPWRGTRLFTFLIVIVTLCETVGYFWLSSVRGPQ